MNPRADGRKKVSATPPDLPGTYLLLLKCLGSTLVSVGRLGSMALHRGWYLYVGSANGQGGLAARLRHHSRPAKRPHWHLDYVQPHLEIAAAWYTTDPASWEHRWAATLAGMDNFQPALVRFGASDCHCAAHLFFTRNRPAPGPFLDQLRKQGWTPPPLHHWRPEKSS